MTLDEFFSGFKESRPIFDVLVLSVDALGPFNISVTKSQIAFKRAKAFAWAWVPGKYLHGKHAPLVLSMAFAKPDESPRWKQIVQVAPGRFIHHLELFPEPDIDDEVRGWLRRAREIADSA